MEALYVAIALTFSSTIIIVKLLSDKRELDSLHGLGVANGLAQVKALRAATVSSQSALESNKLGYEVGVRINIDVLNAENQVYATRRDLAKATLDTLMSQLKLKAAVGKAGQHGLHAD